jgi:hypothetical protein
MLCFLLILKLVVLHLIIADPIDTPILTILHFSLTTSLIFHIRIHFSLLTIDPSLYFGLQILYFLHFLHCHQHFLQSLLNLYYYFLLL